MSMQVNGKTDTIFIIVGELYAHDIYFKQAGRMLYLSKLAVCCT